MPDTPLKLQQKRALKTDRIPIKVVASEPLRKPEWIRARAGGGERFAEVKRVLREANLHTVCEEASCPNIGECFGHGTATFMIMGSLCTRRCPFCDVAHGRPQPLDQDEPRHPGVPTKSGLMVGLGETNEEILDVLRDLRAHSVDMLTIGQYLQPSKHHLPVARYAHPDEFRMFEGEAMRMGFVNAACGPMVRSSYHADLQAATVHG